MRIIALTGHTGSGKSTVARYLQDEYGAIVRSSSAPVRQIAKGLGLAETREVLQNLGGLIYSVLGPETIPNALLKDVPDETNAVLVIDCLRFVEEARALKDRHHYVLVGIETDNTVRLERTRARKQNVNDEILTHELLAEQDVKPTELEIPQLLKKAEWHIPNDGDEASLRRDADELMRHYNRKRVSELASTSA